MSRSVAARSKVAGSNGARAIATVAVAIVLTVAGSAPVWADGDDPPPTAPADQTDDQTGEQPDGTAATDGAPGDGSEGGSESAEPDGEPSSAESDAAGDDGTDGAPAEDDADDIAADGAESDAAGGDGETDGEADGTADQPSGSTTIEQSTEVTGTAVAVATTGNNTAVGTGAATTTSNAVSIASGSATASGNHEQTQVTQEAITTLSGAATAEIVQISIVFNIGGAYAHSGGNSAASIGSNGSTSSTQTGTAVAIGNDSQTYVTQAGRATTAGTQDASVTQQTVTLQFGVATASSGGNVIVATVADGSGGVATITTGAATAVGNESDTSVEQVAQAVGSGNATLTIEQWATIVNIGVALANTGANQIGDLIGAAWADPDGAAAAELFAILLPALLAGDPAASSTGGASTGSGGGSGSISTGSALAVGNRSTTEVQQVAVAVASGDSVAHVRQEVVVVNAGAAIADTGRNQTGAGAAPATLDAAEQAVLEQLTTFVFGLLAEINAWADGTDSTVESSSLTAQLGDQLIGIGGDLSTSTGQTTTASGVLANIRQLTAVINLGLALADSGNNIAITTVQQAAAGPTGSQAAAAGDAAGRTLSSLSTGHVAIVTGDAVAENHTVIIVCQRANMTDHPCLAPEEPAGETDGHEPEDTVLGSPIELDAPAPSALVSAAGIARPATIRSAAEQPQPPPRAAVQAQTANGTGDRSLPATGGAPMHLVLIALGALLTGSTLLAVSRQRRS